jgi:hypothetical protein
MGISPRTLCGIKINKIKNLNDTAKPLLAIFHGLCTNSPANITASLINDLILDYLTMEGYTLAAAKFSKEANLPPQQEASSIQARQDIITLIHGGRIEEAIESLNDLDPEVGKFHLTEMYCPEASAFQRPSA